MLTTLDDLKKYLGITDNSSDAVLTMLIASASAAVEQFIGAPLASETRTERLDGNGADIIHPLVRPITAVSAVSVDDRNFQAAPSMQSNGFEFDYRAVWLRGGERFNLGRRNVEITYTGGYDPIPADISQAVNELIGLRYKERDWIGFVSKSLAGETVTFNTAALPKSSLSALTQYQRVNP